MGMETKHEAATHFVEAGLVLKREDPKGRHGDDPGRGGGGGVEQVLKREDPMGRHGGDQGIHDLI